MINKAVGLWCSGRFPEVAQLMPEGLQGNDIQTRIAWRTFEVWLAEAQGEPLPHRIESSDDDTDSELHLAWLRSADLPRAVAASDHDEVTRLAPLVVEHALAAAGLDDDFFLLWPQSVLAALAVDELDLAERLLAPVTAALPGKRPPVVAAQWHRLRGLLAAARGDDPELAETEMRAGIDALAAFGAAGFHAQAQEELGRWLATQGRAEEAVPLLDAARTTYAEIGATGWLAGLETWDSTANRQRRRPQHRSDAALRGRARCWSARRQGAHRPRTADALPTHPPQVSRAMPLSGCRETGVKSPPPSVAGGSFDARTPSDRRPP